MLRRVPPSINYMRDEKPVIHTSRNGTVHAYVICINQLYHGCKIRALTNCSALTSRRTIPQQFIRAFLANNITAASVHNAAKCFSIRRTPVLTYRTAESNFDRSRSDETTRAVSTACMQSIYDIRHCNSDTACAVFLACAKDATYSDPSIHSVNL
jgi:hypothetical protein